MLKAHDLPESSSIEHLSHLPTFHSVDSRAAVLTGNLYSPSFQPDAAPP